MELDSSDHARGREGLEAFHRLRMGAALFQARGAREGDPEAVGLLAVGSGSARVGGAEESNHGHADRCGRMHRHNSLYFSALRYYTPQQIHLPWLEFPFLFVLCRLLLLHVLLS